jgi:Zn-dependent protease with chaperone function
VTTANSTACPNCSSKVPVDEGYLPWCDACGWNVNPPALVRPPRNAAQHVASKLGARTSAKLAEEVAAGRSGRRWSFALTAAALLVHLFVLGLAVGGAWLIVSTFPNPFAMLPAAAMLGAAWLARPRPSRAPKQLLDRGSYPGLYGLADAVAAEVGARPVHGIAMSVDYNASMGLYGWRQRPIMTIGVPLLAVLGAQERAALMAHELAHDHAGDTWRSLFVGTAENALAELYGLVTPYAMSTTVGGRRYQHQSTLQMTAVNLFMAFVAFLVRPVIRGFWLLEGRQSQRAEYLADRVSAETAGVEAARGLMVKLHATHSLSKLAATAASYGDGDVLGRVRARMANAPKREWDRVERTMQLEETRIAWSHPPTAARIAMLDRLGDRSAEVTVSPELEAEIERELAPLEARASVELLERHRASIYR